jgi:hypothetical protein
MVQYNFKAIQVCFAGAEWNSDDPAPLLLAFDLL